MLDPHLAFRLAGLLAIAGWVSLLIGLFVAPARKITWSAARFAIPALLAVAYLLLIVAGVQGAEGDMFGSLPAIRQLFANDSALAAGWLHYLAFDLFVGTWIAEDSARRHVPALLIVPCFGLTFLFGPVGLLLYFILRAAFAGRAPPELRA